MNKLRNQRSYLLREVGAALLALAIFGSWGCGGSSASAGGRTPTPTPTPVPTPSPTPPPLPAGTIGLKVLDTSVPAGGIFQWQLSNTEPKPIGHGSTRPQVPSGPVRGVAVNDPSGQAAGIAVVNTSVTPTDIKIQVTSPSALLGTNITYPVVTMSMPLSNSLTAGQTFPISIDTANTLFADATKNYTTLEFAPGTLTIAAAGSPFVSDVIPGGGLLPDRSAIKILGANFNANTRVSIEGTSIVASDVTFVNSGEIDVKICNGTVADGATVCPNNGDTFQLDGERVRVKDQSSNFTIEYFTYLRADDVAGASNTALVGLVHPMYSRQTYLSATIPLVNNSTQFTGLSLQNTSVTDSGIKIELLDAGNASLASTSFILPGRSGGNVGKKITRDVVADWFPSPPAGAAKVRMTVTSGPAVQALGMLGDKTAGTIAPVIPQ
ncbi:MAG TPA: hypothetical protein VFF39_17245 [Verrucomicrobiae bacterium]|jgi:hypothetical protein|nr:hypothetical protein [Verrucomicrobiae bacterium]